LSRYVVADRFEENSASVFNGRLVADWRRPGDLPEQRLKGASRHLDA
jgi:hypothetical protein